MKKTPEPLLKELIFRLALGPELKKLTLACENMISHNLNPDLTSAEYGMKRRKGSILIISLWTIFFLSSFAVILSYQIRQRLMVIKRIDERAKLSFIADAAVKKAIIQLKKEEVKAYDSLYDPWSDNSEAFKRVILGNGEFSIGYEYPDSQGVNIRYGLIDEESKINVNTADMDVMERLFRLGLGIEQMQAQELAASIKDWRDKDSSLSIPLGSAEDSYYNSLKYPYDAKDDDIESLDELFLIKGVNSEIFGIINDYITIYGDGMVNVNTASRSALLALGLGEDIADKIIALRNQENNPQDSIFSSVSEVAEKLNQAYSLNEAQLGRIAILAERFLSVASNNFMVRASLRLANSRNTSEIISVIDRGGNILYWKEP